MGKVFLLEAKSGMKSWYGWKPSEVEKILQKNLFVFERAFDVSTHTISVKDDKARMVFEGEPKKVRRFCKALISNVNRQLQYGSHGIFIFSGGLNLSHLSF